MITLQNVTYQAKNRNILDSINWKVEQGQHSLIMGESGSGKTTILHLLAGLLTPSNGNIIIHNQDLTLLSGAALDRWRGRNIGMVFQTFHLIKTLNVADNLALANRMAGLPVDAARSKYLLKKLGLEGKANHYSHQLSVGQAQRVAIARAIINQPKWILADEPTSALDDEHCKATINLLKSEASECGATLILATHDQRITPHFSQILTLGKPIRSAA